MANFKRLIDNPSPTAPQKKGGLIGRIIDHNPPSDHESFEDARRSGFKALRRSLDRRRKKK